MQTDNKLSPAKYISFFMLAVYVCVGVFLFAKLRNLDVIRIAKTFIGSEEKSNSIETASKQKSGKAKDNANRLANRYVEKLVREMEPEPELKRIVESAETFASESQHDIIAELMKLEGRLCMAPTIEPYFARR